MMFNLSKMVKVLVSVLVVVLSGNLYLNAVDVNSDFDDAEVEDVQKADPAEKSEVEDFNIKDGKLTEYNGYAKKVVIPDEVTSIEFGVFLDHEEIEEVIFDQNLVNVEECAFYGCVSLREVILPEGVTTVGRLAFGGCTSLTRFYMGEKLSNFMELCLWGCCSLKEITVSSQNLVFKSVDGILYNKKGDELISCPENKIGNIIIPNDVVTIKEYAFFDCRNIKEVVCGDQLEFIDEASFGGCEGLEKIKFGPKVKKIRSHAFSGCLLLKEVVISESVKFLGSGVFFGCENLKKVVVLSKNIILGEKLFTGCPDIVLCGHESSDIEQYAKDHKYKFELLP